MLKPAESLQMVFKSIFPDLHFSTMLLVADLPFSKCSFCRHIYQPSDRHVLFLAYWPSVCILALWGSSSPASLLQALSFSGKTITYPTHCCMVSVDSQWKQFQGRWIRLWLDISTANTPRYNCLRSPWNGGAAFLLDTSLAWASHL